MTINEYTKEFKACVQMYKELNSDIDNSKKLQKMICDDKGENYLTLLSGLDTTCKEKWKWIKQQAKEQHFTTQQEHISQIHFDGLNRNTYVKLHKEVQKTHQLNGINVIPKRIH